MEEVAAMIPLDATHAAEPLSERRSRLDVDEPRAMHSAITPGPDLPVQHTRPMVAFKIVAPRVAYQAWTGEQPRGLEASAARTLAVPLPLRERRRVRPDR
jgi:hypothetical protein